MFLAPHNFGNIVLLGAGGTGGYIAEHLCRIIYALKRESMTFTICDGDIVEESNLIRQKFLVSDIGGNKAQITAQRCSAAFGLCIDSYSQYIEDTGTLKRLLRKNNCLVPILIGAVDNNRTRQMCNECFHELCNLLYIDSGNGASTGQVVVGLKVENETIFPPVGEVYPDILADKDIFPSEQSCERASISQPQSIAANITAATIVTSVIYNLLTRGNIPTNHVTFSSARIHVKPYYEKLNPQAA